MWKKWMFFLVLFLCTASITEAQQKRIIDPIRNALGFWSRLLNRMAQPRMPSDNELKFRIDDFDLETLEKLLLQEMGGKPGKKLIDEEQLRKLLEPLTISSTTLRPTTTSTAIEEKKAKKVQELVGEENTAKKKIPEAEEGDTDVETLLRLAKKELEEAQAEAELAKKKAHRSRITTTTNSPTTARNIEIVKGEANENATTSETTPETHPSAEAPVETGNQTTSPEIGKAVIDEDIEENLYFEKELRERMKHFEEVESALLSELGSGEEPVESLKPANESAKIAETKNKETTKKFTPTKETSKKEETTKNHTKDVKPKSSKNAESTLKAKTEGETEQEQKKAKDNKKSGSVVEAAAKVVKDSDTTKPKPKNEKKSDTINIKKPESKPKKEPKPKTTRKPSTPKPKRTTTQPEIGADKPVTTTKSSFLEETENSDNTLAKEELKMAFIQSIPDAEEEDTVLPQKIIKDLENGKSAEAKTTKRPGKTTTTTTTLKTLRGNPVVTTTTIKPSRNDSVKASKDKLFPALKSVDERAALKPVEKIVDGLGPLILPLLGYGHDAPEKYYPYLQHGVQNSFVRPDAFSDPKSLPEDIVGMSAAIATELAKSYVADQIASFANAAPAAGPAAFANAPASFPALPTALAAAAPIRPVVASAGRTVNAMSEANPYQHYLAEQQQLQLQQSLTGRSQSPFWQNGVEGLQPKVPLNPVFMSQTPRAPSLDPTSVPPQIPIKQRSPQLADIRYAQPNYPQTMPLQKVKTMYKPFQGPVLKKSELQSRSPYGVAQKNNQQIPSKQKVLKTSNGTPYQRRYFPNPSDYKPKMPQPQSQPQPILTAPPSVYPSVNPVYSSNYNPTLYLSKVGPQYVTYQPGASGVLRSDGPVPLASPPSKGLFSPQMAEKLAASVAAVLPGYSEILGADSNRNVEVAGQNKNENSFGFEANKQIPFLGDSGIIASSSSQNGGPKPPFPDGFSGFQGNSISISGGDHERRARL